MVVNNPYVRNPIFKLLPQGFKIVTFYKHMLIGILMFITKVTNWRVFDSHFKENVGINSSV